MNRLSFLALLLFASTSLRAGAGEPPARLLITTEHSPPSSMLVDGVATGFATEKIRLILQRTGISYTIEMLPWKRAYLLATTQPNTCVYSTARLPEREQAFKWVGPTHETDATLYARADRHLTLNKLDDARQLRIGTYNGDVRSEYLMAHGFNVEPIQNNEANPRKLLLGRIDLWASSTRTGAALIEQNGWTGQIVPVLTYNRVPLYLACNRAVPAPLIAKMNAALQAIKRDGSATAIEHKFDFWQQGPSVPR